MQFVIKALKTNDHHYQRSWHVNGNQLNSMNINNINENYANQLKSTQYQWTSMIINACCLGGPYYVVIYNVCGYIWLKSVVIYSVCGAWFANNVVIYSDWWDGSLFTVFAV